MLARYMEALNRHPLIEEPGSAANIAAEALVIAVETPIDDASLRLAETCSAPFAPRALCGAQRQASPVGGSPHPRCAARPRGPRLECGALGELGRGSRYRRWQCEISAEASGSAWAMINSALFLASARHSAVPSTSEWAAAQPRAASFLERHEASPLQSESEAGRAGICRGLAATSRPHTGPCTIFSKK
jgi:hypothetical protein